MQTADGLCSLLGKNLFVDCVRMCSLLCKSFRADCVKRFSVLRKNFTADCAEMCLTLRNTVLGKNFVADYAKMCLTLRNSFFADCMKYVFFSCARASLWTVLAVLRSCKNFSADCIRCVSSLQELLCGLCKMCSQLCRGCRDQQRKCWMDKVKEWTSLPMPELLAMASR